MNKHNTGYTFVELLVGIGIVTTIFLVGYASFREFSRRQALSGLVKKITSDMRAIQQNSLTGQKPNGVLCSTLAGYSFVSLGNGYRLVANCSNANHIIKTENFDTGVSLSAGQAMFKVLGQGTDLDAEIVFTLTNTILNKTQTITIGKGGNIY